MAYQQQLEENRKKKAAGDDNKNDDNKNEEVKHDFSFNADLDEKVVTLTCDDKITGKKWKCIYTENDYADIDNEFDEMKKAIESGNAEIKPPENDGGALVVKAPPYEFTMQEY